MRWLAVLLLVAPLTGCAALAADDGRVQVTAGFYPLAWVAERVGGADVDVVSLTDPGVEPHDIEPTFARTVALARADLVVVEHGLQPAIDEAVEQNAEGRVLDVTDVVHLRHAGDEHAEEETGDEHDHEHGDVDPHFWLDPALLADVGDAVAADLAALDPQHAASYAANARTCAATCRARRGLRQRPGRLRAAPHRLQPRRVRLLGEVRRSRSRRSPA